MRVYIIGSDGITLCRKMSAAVDHGEVAVASNEELRAAPLSAKRLLALWNVCRCRSERRSATAMPIEIRPSVPRETDSTFRDCPCSPVPEILLPR